MHFVILGEKRLPKKCTLVFCCLFQLVSSLFNTIQIWNSSFLLFFFQKLWLQFQIVGYNCIHRYAKWANLFFLSFVLLKLAAELSVDWLNCIKEACWHSTNHIYLKILPHSQVTSKFSCDVKIKKSYRFIINLQIGTKQILHIAKSRMSIHFNRY